MASAGAVTALQRCMGGNSMQAPAQVSGASKTQNRGKQLGRAYQPPQEGEAGINEMSTA
jgi:hypothetical protein